MIKVIIALLALSFCIPASAAGQRSITPDSVRARVERAGPAETLKVLVETQTLDVLTLGVASGDTAWLEVAALLRPHATPNVDLTLDYAAGQGLLKAPTTVLRLFGAGFAVEHVCTLPFWEPEPEQARRYVQAAEAALTRINDPGLQPMANECLSSIRANGKLNH